MSDFVHLHLHTLYSLLDGAIRMKDLMMGVVEKGMKAVAVTDHGNMFGAVDFYKTARAAGVKPIFGCEAYVAGPKGRKDRTERVSNHLVLLAKDQEGWRNLRYLASMGYMEGHYYHPRIDKELLKKHSKGLFGLTACLGGEVPQLAKRGDMDGARRAALEYKEIFEPGHFFLEIQSNGLADQEKANAELKQLSRDLDIPLAATADSHYVSREDAKAHELLMCIAQGKLFDDPKRMHHETEELYIKSPAEMLAHFSDVPEAVENTVLIGEACNVELDLGNHYLPKFQVPDGHDNDSYLAHLARRGLDRRFEEITKRYPVDRDAYRERLETELSVIQKMGFSGYFLIVQDFINWAKEHGIPVGPGRGSGAGSLVAYSLRITDLDPIPYALLFERFLNPERVSMPDFDVDFCQTRRGQVIDYVTRKYGEHNVGQIITFGQLSAKSAIKDVGRVLGLTFGECNELTKNIPNLVDGKPPTIEKALEADPALQARVDSDPRITEVFRIAKALQGLNRQAGMHAAGVVIADKPLWEYVPLYQPSGEKFLVTQYAKDEVEEAGLVKFDFLGLKTLTVIDDAVQMINANHPDQPKVTAELIPLDDPEVYAMLSRGDTQGVFQLESGGFTDLVKRLKPDRFEDIVAAGALYRPGPLQTGMVDDFIERKHGRQKIVYPHPALEATLRPTYGVIVYQEQVMQISQVLGGYTLGRADLLRRAMGKKKADVMHKERAGFIEGATKNGVDPKLAGEIFDLMEKFAAYGFNKCVVGATRVVDARTGALVRVDELFARRPKGFETLSLHEPSGRIVPRQVLDVVENGVKPVFTLTTAAGKKVVATGNHPFLTRSGWKNLEDLEVGEAIATPAQLPLERGASWPRHKLVALAALCAGKVETVAGGIDVRLASVALAADFDHAARSFRRTSAAHEGRLVSVRGSEPFTPAGTSLAVHHAVETCGLLEWAQAHDFLGGRVPPDLATLRDADLELFLGRLWSAAGTLSKTPTLSVPREDDARALQHLFHRLGVATKLRRGTSAWKLEVAGAAAVERFHHRVGPHLVGRDDERREMAERILSSQWSAAPADDVRWDAVASIEPAGEEMTYDLTVDESHNFVADGVIVHNSHSAAYALITMQTAWLKCHHRAEFMAALLTSDADKTEKLVAHIADAREHGLEVLPPDINESARSFHGKDKQIRFGLGGIKGVGETAIDAILEAREQEGGKGPFVGLYDFCERVDLRRVNRKVIECLVRCGAFDFTGVPRWSLFAAIDAALERGQAAQRDRASGQASLFGLLAGPAQAKAKEAGADGEYPEVEAWTDREKLAGERETLGFYITGHPLDQYAEEIARYATHSAAKILSAAKAGEIVRIVGVVSALRSRPTKTGKLMGFATLEDLTGTVEVICFAGGRRPGPPIPGRPPARTGGFEVWQPLLESDQPLLVSGTVQMNTRDEENPIPELIADDVTPLAEVRARRASRYTVTLDADQVSPEKLQRARGFLEQHPGPLTVELRIRIPDAAETRVVVRDLKVAPTDELGDRLNLLFGGAVVGVEA
ncbi:MAG TPA: DNA polymerase III subunit alpha [Vulgatibacter sp.]|nr:DNA polymerase III subunit alpha [Vulgatibacter sp.]